MIRNIIIGWYRRFFKPITEEEKQRLQTCLTCPDKIKLGKEYVCKHCGCPVKSKIRVDKEKCYLNKW